MAAGDLRDRVADGRSRRQVEIDAADARGLAVAPASKKRV